MSNPGQITSEILLRRMNSLTGKQYGAKVAEPPPWAELRVRKDPRGSSLRDPWRAYVTWKGEGLNAEGKVCTETDYVQLIVRGSVFESVLALAIRLMETQVWLKSDGLKDGEGSE